MASRLSGTYRETATGEERVRAFVPHPLPPREPPFDFHPALVLRATRARESIARLRVAAEAVPNVEWFLYGFVRKEAVLTSQIEGTQCTLQDVLSFEATKTTDRPADVREVCNYVEALNYARRELRKPRGLPLSIRLLCGAHQRLMRGARGADKEPGQIRRSQNWIGGTRPGNAAYVPPPPEATSELLSDLERWLHSDDPLDPLVRIGLAHAQFESIHPFLDGNGRIGRLLIALLMEQWKLLPAPLLYVSLELKRHRSEYYDRLMAVRLAGDWEGWIEFFLDCVTRASDDGARAAQRLFTLVNARRQALLAQRSVTIAALRLFELLPTRPLLTLGVASKLIKRSKPTTTKAIEILLRAKILREITGGKRDRIYAFHEYLALLTDDTAEPL